MVRCPTEQELALFLEGRSPPEEARRIEEHRNSCASCGTRIREAAEEDELFGDVQRVIQTNPPPVPADPADLPSISRYKILRRLGAGGMGVVYEAEQKNPQRRVALKLIRPGFATPRSLRRLEHEAQVLARLDHPGIARVLEADAVELHGERQPFFAMELVEGKPLDEYAASEQLSVRARLELFLKICEAVQHAHQRAVMHRDLKPGNVLVTADGQPKVLDFGIARTLDQQELSASLRSRTGEILGTLPYMSPEAVSGRVDEIDVRTDVYSLGVLLYELCSGTIPFSVSDTSLPEAIRIISETDPTPLGRRDRHLAGDLETIAAKALRKEKNERYDSVSALAEDVRRHLDHLPIQARPPSTWMQIRKFTRRNRTLVTGAVLAILLLISGIVATTIQARRAQRAERIANEEREAAQIEAAATEEVNEFLVDVLVPHTPGQDPAGYTVREALARAEERMERGGFEDPRVEASVRVAIGLSYLGLRDYEKAEAHLLEAVALRVRAHGENHLRTAGATNALGNLYFEWQRYAEAEEAYLRAIEIYDASGEGDSPQAGTTRYNLCQIVLNRGDVEEAETLALEALERHRPHERQYPAHVAMDLIYLASARAKQGDALGAEESLRESLAVLERTGHGDSLYAATSTSHYAKFLLDKGRYEEAETYALQSFEIRERLLERDHPHMLRAVQRLASIYEAQDRPDEADYLRDSFNSD